MDADARSLVTGKICPTCQIKYNPEIDRCPTDNSLLAVVRRDPFIGKLIADKYEIVEILGMGGFSTVYKATQKGLRRAVAIKILHAEFVDKPEKIRRFQQEAESISSLVHPNVAAVYDYGVMAEGQPYLAMELAPGTTLAAVLAKTKTLDPDRAVAIFLQACDGIAAAHATGLIHRDLKPANIVLNQGEDGCDQVKILDFGLAKVISDEGGARENLTMTGEILGTPAYMAPEQCMGTQTDVRTDVYSFGCVMYETLSGHLAVDGDNSYEMMNKHINHAPVSLSKSGVPVPPKLVRIVSKALQKDPDDRFQNFDELKDALLGVEPAIAKEIKDLLFSSGSTKLSKKKKSLKKRILMSVWTVVLVALSIFGLTTYDQMSINSIQGISKKFEGKIVTYDAGMFVLDCPAIYKPETAPDKEIILRFMSRVCKNNYIDFKDLGGRMGPAEWAAAQRRLHKTYPKFVEVTPIQKYDFGKGKSIHGYITEYCYDRLDGFIRERQVYWGEPGKVLKLKVARQETPDGKYQQVFDTIYNTVEYHPEKKCVAPKVE